MKFNIRYLYLYLFSFIGLVVIVIATIRLVDLGLKSVFFTEADKYGTYMPKRPVPTDSMDGVEDEMMRMESVRLDQVRSRQRDLSNSIAMLVVGIPLYAYHWRLIKREGGDKK